MTSLIKFIIWLIGMCAIWFIGLLPEFIMYGMWNMINPQSDLTKITTAILFYLGGASLSIGFFILAVIATVFWTLSMAESRY